MKLPPMNTLPVFEAVARLASFTHAGQELSLSQSAISHQIRQLESYLGESLFERKGRYTHLTSLGKTYYDTVASALITLERGSEEIKGRPSTTVRLALFSSFAVRWLIPNLITFNHDYPNLDLQLEMTSESPVLSDRVADCFITLHNDIPGFEFSPVYTESIFAVCSKQYWADLTSKPGLQSNNGDLFQYLEKATLLTTYTLFYQNKEDWRRWYMANGIDMPTTRVQSFSHMLLALEAARHHQGITLTNDYMFQETRDQDLIKLPFNSFQTGDCFYLAYKVSRRKEKAIRDLRQWIVKMANQTGLLT